MKSYYLMHKNIPCASIVFDDDTWRIAAYHTINPEFTPFLGTCDLSKFRKWWEARAVPASRELMKSVMRDAGCLTPESYLAKNLALSMTDTYWVCPSDLDISYDNISFTAIAEKTGGKVPYHNATSYDPNASLGGQMNKYWDLSGPIPVLVKESYKYYGQQALNEVFATKLHEMQDTNVPFVRYTASRTEDGGYLCKCNAFTSRHAELIPAYEVLESGKTKNDQNNYNAYIELCVRSGLDSELIQHFMDYQTLTDFIISNTDEHLMNFGILRDPETMKIIGPAPIFDSGNSMFYADEWLHVYSRAEILQRKITSFYTSEEKLLRNVRDYSVVRYDRLPEPDFVREFYASAGLPENKAEIISRNYMTKLEFLRELQQGKTLSLYREKQAEKKRPIELKNPERVNKKELILIAGPIDSGKTKVARNIINNYLSMGYDRIDPESLYPTGRADSDCPWFIDENKVLGMMEKRNSSKHNSFVYISTNDIRHERKMIGLKENDDYVFLTAMARIRQACLDGINVIYSATNMTREARERVLAAAGEHGIHKTAIMIDPDPERAAIYFELPTYSEGWDEIQYEKERKLNVEHNTDNRNDR